MIYKNVRKHTSSGRRRTQAEIIDSYYSNFKYKCNCGHTIFMPYGTDKKICTHCGLYVYKDKKDEFKDKLNQELRRKKSE